MYRHDLTIREVPESAVRRAAQEAAAQAAAEAERPTPPPVAAPGTDRGDGGPATPGGDARHVGVASDASGWGSAIARMRNPTARATLQDEPLTFSEMAGVEAVLVNLRVDALIEQLRAAGLVRAEAVDHSFQRLIRDRFLRDATPVVGEHAARRAARQLAGQ